MLKKLSSLFGLYKYLPKVKEVLETTYLSIVKVNTALSFIQTEIDAVPMSNKVKPVLEKTIEVLGKIQTAFEKYGKLIGLETGVVAQSFINESTFMYELEKSSHELNNIIK
jgi:hypothetical protein